MPKLKEEQQRFLKFLGQHIVTNTDAIVVKEALDRDWYPDYERTRLNSLRATYGGVWKKYKKRNNE